ncbi:Permease of the drug/metabolite transporter (DMT) superfamily [hydrothermal vent metagenome]|uniref:Permease of the drug/metabolite transporter (DMT) superfamily n=1 Tax=hydrothermal vent metagenome TaxID=652676 RepID=A0A3B1A4W7_9ZZZZ
MKAHPYRLFAGFIIIILIWSTTPLAIKWSGEGPGFIFGVSARMTIGLVLLLIIAFIKKVPIPLHKQALQTYFAAGIGIYGAMLAVYWGAQFIQSGFISVLFGLTPFMTSLLAYFILQEKSWSAPKLFGLFMGIIGLFFIFWQSIDFGGEAVYGIAAVLLSVFIHASSAVAVKRVHGDLASSSVTTGGMLIATPTYLVTWFFLDGEFPEDIPDHALWSIIYLGVIATTIGFNLYFYVLKHMQANQVALLTLVTPVLALWIGQIFNHEKLVWGAWIGSAMILMGMSVYQWSYLLPRIWLRDKK